MSKVTHDELVSRGFTLTQKEAQELHPIVSQIAQHVEHNGIVYPKQHEPMKQPRYVPPAQPEKEEGDLSKLELMQGPSHGGNVTDGKVKKG